MQTPVTEMVKSIPADDGTTAPIYRPAATQLYASSWVDRLNEWVARLPVPWWLFYIALGAGLLLIESATKWIDGMYPLGTFNLFHVSMVGTFVFALALIFYTDQAAARALDNFRPAADMDEGEFEEIRYKLTTMPSLPVLLACGALVVPGVLVAVQTLLFDVKLRRDMIGQIFTSDLSVVVDMPLYLAMWIGYGLVAYHTVRQLNLVSGIYQKHTRVNLFDLAPVYAFSGLTARTSIAIMLGVYATFFLFPQAMREYSGNLWLFASLLLLSLATFVLPLWGVHRLLVKEKVSLLAEVNGRIKNHIHDLHDIMDNANQHTTLDVTRLSRGLEALVVERNLLGAIPTWPWQAQTLNTVLSAFLLPILGLAGDRLLRILLDIH